MGMAEPANSLVLDTASQRMGNSPLIVMLGSCTKVLVQVRSQVVGHSGAYHVQTEIWRGLDVQGRQLSILHYTCT